MEDAPDDILRLIFGTYIHDLRRSPANLLTVNRRWHAILVGTGTFWTRISIVIDSFNTIPYLIAIQRNHISHITTAPLLVYLRRSLRLPLDISIRWRNSENSSIATGPHLSIGFSSLGLMRNVCRSTQADAGSPETDKNDYNSQMDDDYIRKMQTKELIRHLSGEKPLPGPHSGIHSGVECYIERWRSFELVMIPYTDELAFTSDAVPIRFVKRPSETVMLTCLTSLAVRGAFLVLTGVNIPSLVDLNIDYAKVIGYPNLRLVEKLRWRGEAGKNIDWEELKRLRILHIHSLDSFTIPQSHN